MKTRILIAHARDEEERARELARPVEAAGYEVVHGGTVLVGDSIVAEYSRLLAEGAPVVLCGTVRAMGTKWARHVAAAARAHAGVRLYVVQMEEEADVESVSHDEAIARYWQDPHKARSDLVAALRKHYPPSTAEPAGQRLMRQDLESRYREVAHIGWTEEQWNRVCIAVEEEGNRARVAAKLLPIAREHANTNPAPEYTIGTLPELSSVEPVATAPQRLVVRRTTELIFTTISIKVHLGSREVDDPSLSEALSLFRRAASYIAQIEDAIVFNGRDPNRPRCEVATIPQVYTVTGDGVLQGLCCLPTPAGQGIPIPTRQKVCRLTTGDGDDIAIAIINAIGEMESIGHRGPFACALSNDLFELISMHNSNLLVPSERLRPFLQDRLVSTTALRFRHGVVVSLGAHPAEIVMGSELGVEYLERTLEPRYVFRVFERFALRIRDADAIAVVK